MFLDGSVSLKEVQEWIEDSYDLVVDNLPKTLRSRLQQEIRDLDD